MQRWLRPCYSCCTSPALDEADGLLLDGPAQNAEPVDLKAAVTEALAALAPVVALSSSLSRAASLLEGHTSRPATVRLASRPETLRLASTNSVKTETSVRPPRFGRRPSLEFARSSAAPEDVASLRSSPRLPSMRSSDDLEQQNEGWPLRGKYCAFLSHYKTEAATEARLCQFELEKMLKGPVFIDSDDLKDLRLLTEHVRQADVLVLLLTQKLFTRPWCLLEIYTAITSDVPIVALAVRGSHPYNYDVRRARDRRRARVARARVVGTCHSREAPIAPPSP